MKDYKTILEGVVNIINTTEKSDIGFANICSYIGENCPELKESEDERIRKALIEHFRWNVQQILNDFDNKEVLDWLEKQGKNNMGISEATKQELEDNLNNALEKETPESWNEFLDEQGEQKSIKTCAEYYNQDNELKMPELSEFQNKLADILMYREYDGPDETEDDIAKGRLEYELAAIRLSEELLPLAQKEQKPADKVEPKFKVGDWITDGTSVFQIVKIEGEWYIADDGERVCFDVVHQYYHLWTIEDAKDGDVLCTKNKCCPFIYDKGRYNNGLAYYYAGIDVSGNLNIKSPHNMLAHFGRLDNIRPATKEQREILFQKMKEAGYEWDTEKKELRRIENEIEIPFGAKDSELQEATYYIPKGFYAEIEGNNIIIKKGEQNTAWSEEDLMPREEIINLLQKYGMDNEVAWLKSLRPQSHWKPSEEQMDKK